MTQSNCGLAPTNNQRCGEFDHNGAGAVVDSTDFNLAKAAVSKLIKRSMGVTARRWCSRARP